MSLNLLPYNNIDLKTNRILEQLTLSSRALAELKGYANTIPNMHILINIEITSKETIELIKNIQNEIMEYKKEFKAFLFFGVQILWAGPYMYGSIFCSYSFLHKTLMPRQF